MTRGIRQGCPLSPLLYAACSDLMLRRLAVRFPGATIRAFADDLAMVLGEARQHLGRLQSFFQEFELVSGLGLNIRKTVLVPMCPLEEDNVRALVHACAPGWGGLTIAEAAKYLGMYLGPGGRQLSWDAPIKKFLTRASQWGKLGVGLLMSIKAYRVYIASVLLFVGQLVPLPPDFRHTEALACRRLA